MNQELKQALLGRYEVRKSKRQKRAFQEFVQEYCRQAGWACRVETPKGSSSGNIVIGDADGADVVFTAHYDTCALMPVPNLITPLNRPLYILYQAVITLLMLAAGGLGWWIVERFAPGWGRAGFIAVLALCVWQMMCGVRNRHTANDNTSGVATILEAAAGMPAELRDRAAFVLFDNEEKGMLGSSAFARQHRDTVCKKPLVNFDCVSDGGNMLFCCSKTAEKLPCMGRIRESFSAVMRAAGKQSVTPAPGKAIYPSDQNRFPYGAAVAALKENRFGTLYMDRIHTGRDVIFQEENIDAAAEFIRAVAADPEIRPAETAPKQMPGWLAFALVIAVSAAVGAAIGLALAMKKI